MIARLVFSALICFAGPLEAQDYPARPVTVVIPFSGGSASDVIARIALERMGTSIGQRFVVDNRPAAGGNVGTLAVTKAAPDGYTIVMTTSGPLAANKTLYPNLGYDPERDLQPISMFASLPNVIVVSAKLPIKTLAEFTDYVKQKPNLPYGSVGNGSSQHLAGAYFEQIAGVRMTHVPYRVTAQLVTDLVAGEVPLGFQLVPNVLGQIKGGQIRPIAVASNRRLSALPNVPTAAEMGVKGYECAAWFAFLAPRATPRPIIDKLHASVVTAMNDPAIRARFIEFGAEPMATTPEELGRFISSEVVKWREIITKAGITLDP
jgi:tripartite-type tricarboxylate transporter receptor subunit TctC